MKSKIFILLTFFSILTFAKLPSDWNSAPISWRDAKLVLACESARLISGPSKTMTPFHLAIVTSNDHKLYKGLFILKNAPAPFHPSRYLSGYLISQQEKDILTYEDKTTKDHFSLEVDLSKKTTKVATFKSGKWHVEMTCSTEE